MSGSTNSLANGMSDRTVTVVSVAIIAVACLLRLAWVWHGHLAAIDSEAFFIARALAEGRGFAEAFGPGTGPTAHLMPLTPLPAAAVYALLGQGTAAELVLTAWALALLAVSLLLAERVMRELGTPPLARLAGVAIVALVPIQYALELVGFRVWDGALAAAGLLAILLAALRLDRSSEVAARTLLLLGIGNGLVFLVNPAAAIGTSGIIGVLLLRRVSWRRWWLPVATSAVVIAAVLVPWGLRNERMLGAFVPLRTGSGISMAIAYYDGRDSEADLARTEEAHFKEISPLMGVEARRRYMRLGEIGYNAELRERASAWIAAHRGEVLAIRLRNFVQFYAPPARLWTRFTRDAGKFVPLRQYLVAFASIVAVAGVVIALVRGRRRWWYVAMAILLPSLPYIYTYSLLRYRYLISTLLIFLAVDGAARLLALLTRRRPPAVA